LIAAAIYLVESGSLQPIYKAVVVLAIQATALKLSYCSAVRICLLIGSSLVAVLADEQAESVDNKNDEMQNAKSRCAN